MTALYMDGFDHYGTGAASSSAMLSGPYSQVNYGVCGAPPWGPARTGTNCLVQPGRAAFNDYVAYRVLPTPGTHFYVSFGFAVDQLSNNGGNQMIAFKDGSANTLFSLGWTSTGVMQLYGAPTAPNLTGTLLGSTSGPVIVAQNWHFIEMAVDTGANTFTLRVDDAQATNTPVMVVDNAGVTGTIAQLAFLSGNPAGTVPPQSYMDDLFVRDSNGTLNNSWLGDRRVATLFANADTTTTGWTPSYYKEFGAGILTLSYATAGTTAISNPTAYVSTAAASALDIGNADFTLESWVRFDKLPAPSSFSQIFGRWDEYNNLRSYRLLYGGSAYNDSCLQFDTSVNGTVATTKLLYPATITPNTWHHLAVCRSSGELLLFLDGVQLGLPLLDTDTYFSGGTEAFTIGNQIQVVGGSPEVVPNTNYIGRLDETRFTNGVGRYTTTFIPPTTAFPRGSTDPDWAEVVLIMGYDSGVVDESGFLRTMSTFNGATAFVPVDGPQLGKYTTVNKAVPDDNTFISASLVNASNVGTMTTQPTAGTSVEVGTRDGTTAAVYTWRTSVSAAFDVLIDTTVEGSLINLLNAINGGPGAGTKYGAGTTSNFDVNAVQLPVGQIQVFANVAGTGGNSILSTTNSTFSWASGTLTGGANIPGPTNFKVQRPPNNTTLISAMQMNFRGLKTDAGTANVQQSFIGGLGGTVNGTIKAMTVSPSYYADIMETDPDTGNAISPTTIINGQLKINRTT